MPPQRKKRKVIVLACLIAENIEEGAGGSFSLCAFCIAVQENIRDGCRNAGVLEDTGSCSGFRARNDCPLCDIGRNQNCRDTHTQIIEIKWCPGIRGRCLCLIVVWCAIGRSHMVVDSAMLVIDDQQRCAVPDSRISVDGVVYPGDEFLAFLHVVIGMLVRSQNLSPSRASWAVVAVLY